MITLTRYTRAVAIAAYACVCWAAGVGFVLACTATASAQEPAWQKAFLWQVQKGEHTLYLLGGMSAGKQEFYPMPASVAEAIRASDVIALESDLDDDAGNQRALRLGTYPTGDSIDRHLPTDLYQELTDLAANFDIPEAQLRALRPWMVYFQIVFRDFLNAGYQTDLSTDTIVYALAKGDDKPVIGMEPGDWSARYLNAMPDDLQQAMLRGLLLEMKDGNAVKSLENLWRALRTADETAFLAAVEESERFYPRADELREVLFFARHPAMIEKIDSYLVSGKKHLVVLGAVNLLGPRGLVAALRAKGYSIKLL